MGMQKISSQIPLELLAEVHMLAAAEGKEFQSVLDEALTEWVAKRKDEPPEVLARARSRERRRKLYEELANWSNLSRL